VKVLFALICISFVGVVVGQWKILDCTRGNVKIPCQAAVETLEFETMEKVLYLKVTAKNAEDGHLNGGYFRLRVSAQVLGFWVPAFDNTNFSCAWPGVECDPPYEQNNPNGIVFSAGERKTIPLDMMGPLAYAVVNAAQFYAEATFTTLDRTSVWAHVEAYFTCNVNVPSCAIPKMALSPS